MKFVILTYGFLISLAASATKETYQFIGKCSWDHTSDYHYSAGYALAEFYLHVDNGIVYVHNFIAEKDGDFREIPNLEVVKQLQEAGKKGVRNYVWDSGESEVSFAGRPLNEVHLATATKNKLGSNGNAYAPCYFIGE